MEYIALEKHKILVEVLSHAKFFSIQAEKLFSQYTYILIAMLSISVYMKIISLLLCGDPKV